MVGVCKFIVLYVLFGCACATTVDLEAEADIVRDAWSIMDTMFLESFDANEHGTKATFPKSWTVSVVLNPYNRVYAKKVIADLTLSTKHELHILCKEELAREFQVQWMRVKARMEEEIERFHVPSALLLHRLREMRMDIKRLINPNQVSNNDEHLEETYLDDIVRVLQHLVKRPSKARPDQVFKAYYQVDALVQEARDEGYNDPAILHLLTNAEWTLLRTTKVEPPASFEKNFEFIAEQCSHWEQCLEAIDQCEPPPQ